MKHTLLGVLLLGIVSTTQAQTPAVQFASDAGVFVGAAMGCKMMQLVKRYTLRVRSVVTDLAANAAEKRQAMDAFAEMRAVARRSQQETPVSSCDDVRRMVRDRPLMRRFNKKAQAQLHALGFDPGVADGIWGPQSQEALRQYQTRQGLPATGEIDRATLTALDLKLIDPTQTPLVTAEAQR